MANRLHIIALSMLLAGCASESVSLGESAYQGSWSEMREVCLNFINERRASENKAALLLWFDASDCTESQAAADFHTNSPHDHFGKCGETAQNTCPGWPAGYDFDSQKKALLSCLQEMWDEKSAGWFSEDGHYINMSNSAYTKVTCGFHLNDGKLWVNQNYR
jgi:hypothetical protein